MSVHVSMPPKRAAWVTYAVPVWLALWTAALLTQASTGEAALVAGVLAALAVLLLWLWLVAGREEAEVSGGTLTLRRRVGPLSHQRSFAAVEVHDLRALPPARTGWRDAFGVTHASLAFDHGGRTHHFAGGLDHAEAVRVAERLREALA